jgi:hypothetical protein
MLYWSLQNCLHFVWNYEDWGLKFDTNSTQYWCWMTKLIYRRENVNERTPSILGEKRLKSEFVWILEIEGLRAALLLNEQTYINVERKFYQYWKNELFKSKCVCILYKTLEIEGLRSALVLHNIGVEQHTSFKCRGNILSILWKWIIEIKVHLHFV